MITSSVLSSSRRLWSTAILLLGGALVTFVSVIVAATLPLIGTHFLTNTATLGTILGAYVAGFALFQVPAGFGALRTGARSIYLLGLLLMGGASLLCGFSGNLLELGLLRFVAGAGQALQSGTAYSLLSTYYPEGQRGKFFGIFVGVTNGIGGLLGLPASTALGVSYGWAVPFELMGAIVLIVTGLSFVILPAVQSTKKAEQLSAIWSMGLKIFRSKSIWGLALGLAGFTAASYTPIDYVAQYFSQVHPAWGIHTASYIAATGIGFTFPGGILGGWIGDRGFSRKRVMLCLGVVFGLLWILLPYIPLDAYWGLYAVAGIAVGLAAALTFLIPSLLEESRGEGVTLAIGLINTTQLIFTSGFLAFFGFLSVTSGFNPAWTASGLVTLALLPFLFLVASNSRPVKLVESKV
jgi:MFS transporter, ACS family, D-galactonate transporter